MTEHLGFGRRFAKFSARRVSNAAGFTRQPTYSTSCPRAFNRKRNKPSTKSGWLRRGRSGSRKASLAMMFKLGKAAEKRWRRLNGYQKIIPLIQGIKFVNGIIHDPRSRARSIRRPSWMPPNQFPRTQHLTITHTKNLFAIVCLNFAKFRHQMSLSMIHSGFAKTAEFSEFLHEILACIACELVDCS